LNDLERDLTICVSSKVLLLGHARSTRKDVHLQP